MIQTLEVDVVVLGSGVAGATAAIEADRHGASVLVIDSAPRPLIGGNSRASAHGFLCPDDEGATQRYIRELSCHSEFAPGRIEVWAREACANASWLASYGIPAAPSSATNEPDFPDLPGAGSTRKFSVCSPLGLWGVLEKEVRARGITRLYVAKVQQMRAACKGPSFTLLVQTPFCHVRVRSKYGIVVATGGYAASTRRMQSFSGVTTRTVATGSPFNLGLGLYIGQHVRARMRGLQAYTGPYAGFVPPGSRTSVPIHPLTLGIDGYLVVDQTGSSIDVNRGARRHGIWRTPQGRHVRLSLPSVMVLIVDEAVVDKYPLVATAGQAGGSGWARGVEGLPWSADNSREIEAGWLRSVDRVSHEEPRLRRYLQKACNDNGIAARGAHVLRLLPTYLNTQGGPERDSRSQLVQVNGMPVEGVYSAGELGSIFPMFYQGAGNLADALVSGRLAGRGILS